MKQIPQGFPNSILNDNDEFCFKTTMKLSSEEFTLEFDDILSDKLNPLSMKGDPMRISLKPNAIPKKVTGVRRVYYYATGQDSNGNKRSALEEDLLGTDSIFHDS